LRKKVRNFFRNDFQQGRKYLTTFANLYPEMLRASSLQGIFISIEENLAKAIQIEVNRDAFVDTENQQFVEKIRAYIEANYADENLSLQTVAEHMKMSARYVSKKFKYEYFSVNLNPNGISLFPYNYRLYYGKRKINPGTIFCSACKV